MSRKEMDQYSDAFRSQPAVTGPWNPSRSPIYHDPHASGSMYDSAFSSRMPSVTPTTSTYNLPVGTNGYSSRTEASYPPVSMSAYMSAARPQSGSYVTSGPGFGPSYKGSTSSSPGAVWDNRYSPTESVDDIIASPNLSDYCLDSAGPSTTPPGGSGKNKMNGGKAASRSQRRPSNRDEFDGPHQFLQPPPPEYIAMQERDLPHLPTNLHVQEQDSVLAQVNDRLSQCAFDFVAKYQFPIPLTQDMRPVERPQDREWTEWVYLLKRLATKRRIPARVLYNGQIKQFVTILENSLEMRHAAKHQSRPLKDDRNILQLISAGIQVAKILKDASAMDYLDQLYVSTEKQIQQRAAARGPFRT